MKNIFQYFSWIISQFMCPSSQLLNKYISFQLAVHNLVKCPLHNNFPHYLISFEEINFGIFCRCLIQFFNNPFGYDFESNKDGLAKMIEHQFEKAIYSNYSQSGPEIFQLRNFFSILIRKYVITQPFTDRMTRTRSRYTFSTNLWEKIHSVALCSLYFEKLDV